MADDPRTGKMLQGRYKMGGRLAEGGMGIIYAAERVGIGRPVVVKFLHAVLTDRPGIVDRFEREARATARLNHPNCVALVDFGIEDGAPFLVMELVEGQTLADVLDHGALEPSRAVRIALQVLAGLAHAHERGILHRDLKPANVMIIDAVGWTDFVKILDFGLAKLLGTPEPGVAGKREVTVEGIAIGTPGYMSPEQAAGVPSDRRSDVYCTGALLYHLVTGTKAFAGSDVHEVLRRHREETPASPRAAAAGISVELDEVIRHAMERDPLKRFQSADEMSEALRATPEAREAPDKPREGKRPRPPAPPAGDETRAELPSSRARARAPVAPRRSGLLLAVGLILGASGTVAAALYTPLGGELLAHISPGSADAERAGTSSNHHAKETSNAASNTTSNPTATAGLGAKTGANPDRVSVNDHVVVAAAPADLAVPAPTPDLAPPAASPTDRAAPSAADDESTDDGAGEDPRAQPAEPASAPHREMPQVRAIADVRALVRKDDADGALAGLYRLRRQKPAPSAQKSAEIAALLGHLYYDRRWWTDALREYRFALVLSPRERSNAILVGNAVHTLADGKTWMRARKLLIDYVGRGALPALKRLARASSSPAALRKRAQQVIAAIVDGKSRGR